MFSIITTFNKKWRTPELSDIKITSFRPIIIGESWEMSCEASSADEIKYDPPPPVITLTPSVNKRLLPKTPFPPMEWSTITLIGCWMSVLTAFSKLPPDLDVCKYRGANANGFGKSQGIDPPELLEAKKAFLKFFLKCLNIFNDN